jgi:hypothetical protein
MDKQKTLDYIRERLENQVHPYTEVWDGGFCTALTTIEEKIINGDFDE